MHQAPKLLDETKLSVLPPRVHYRMDVQPGLVAIPVGAFADPSFPPPFLSFYHEARRCEWVETHTEPLQTFG